MYLNDYSHISVSLPCFCHVSRTHARFSKEYKFIISLFLFFFINSRVVLFPDPIWVRVLIAFSIPRNIKAMMSTKMPRGAIGSINGIKVISLMWVIVGHAFANLNGSKLGKFFELILLPNLFETGFYY